MYFIKINNPDKRVEIIKNFVIANFPSHPLLTYAIEVEKVTTAKVLLKYKFFWYHNLFLRNQI